LNSFAFSSISVLGSVSVSDLVKNRLLSRGQFSDLSDGLLGLNRFVYVKEFWICVLTFFASTWPSVILFLYHFAFYLIFLSLIAISEGTSLFSRGIAAQPELLLGPLHRHLSSAILHLLEHHVQLASQLLRLLKLFFFVRQSLPRLASPIVIESILDFSSASAFNSARILAFSAATFWARSLASCSALALAAAFAFSTLILLSSATLFA